MVLGGDEAVYDIALSIPLLLLESLAARTGRRALAGNVEVNKDTLISINSSALRYNGRALQLTASFSILSASRAFCLSGTSMD